MYSVTTNITLNGRLPGRAFLVLNASQSQSPPIYKWWHRMLPLMKQHAAAKGIITLTITWHILLNSSETWSQRHKFSHLWSSSGEERRSHGADRRGRLRPNVLSRPLLVVASAWWSPHAGWPRGSHHGRSSIGSSLRATHSCKGSPNASISIQTEQFNSSNLTQQCNNYIQIQTRSISILEDQESAGSLYNCITISEMIQYWRLVSGNSSFYSKRLKQD